MKSILIMVINRSFIPPVYISQVIAFFLIHHTDAPALGNYIKRMPRWWERKLWYLDYVGLLICLVFYDVSFALLLFVVLIRHYWLKVLLRLFDNSIRFQSESPPISCFNNNYFYSIEIISINIYSKNKVINYQLVFGIITAVQYTRIAAIHGNSV